MGAFFWGMIGGAIIILAKKGGALQSEAESAAATRPGILARLKFCSSEAIENFRDLAAESKMEWESEKVAIEEVRLHNKKQK